MAFFPSITSFSIFSALLALFSVTCHAGTAPISSYPLAVRNPYLSAWLPGNETADITTAEPQFWMGQPLTWPILARVDGKAYTLFGAPNGVQHATAAKTNGISFTATHTYMNLTAGSANIGLDFFSPVDPTDFVRQSLPFSYLTVTATPVSGSDPDVQVFSAFDYSWTSKNGSFVSSFQDNAGTLYFNMSASNQILFTENNQQAAWGSAVFASEPVNNSTLTYQAGPCSSVEQAFIKDGKLAGTAASFATGNLYAFAQDLGKIGSGAAARFAVGFDMEEAVNFFGTSYTQYWRSVYPEGIHDAIPAFFQDYSSALSSSQAFDQKVVSKGAAFSTNYTDLLEASARQIYGAMEVCLPLAAALDNDQSNPLVFLKEISSNGDASTVDVIYPTHTALYLLSGDYLQLLLEPYLIYLNTNKWPHQYIPHDLGTFPNYLGHDDGIDEAIIVEATGSFFIMILANLKSTGGNGSWLTPYKQKLITAANYLVNNGLYPSSQLSTVDAIPATANQTGLAMCAAIGLKAIGQALGLNNYTNTGKQFASKIYPELGTDNAKSPTHFTYNYGLDSSWGTAFHLLPDQLYGLDTFPLNASSIEADWYAKQYLPNGDVPYAYQVDFAISEWSVWAGAVSDLAKKSDMIQERAINMVHQFITNGLNNVPFPTKFNVKGSAIGIYIQNKARPTVGSMWAPMALNGQWNS